MAMNNCSGTQSISRPSGTAFFFRPDPALKRWAISVAPLRGGRGKLQLKCYTNGKLQDTWHVSVGGEHKVLRTHVVVHSAPLRVVKDVEPLGPELHVEFFRGFENFVYRHVKIGTAGLGQAVSSRVAEGQSLGLLVGAGIVKLGTGRSGIRDWARSSVGIANDVGIRTVSRNAIGDACVVAEHAVHY